MIAVFCCLHPMRKENLYTVSLLYIRGEQNVLLLFVCPRVCRNDLLSFVLLYFYCILYSCTLLMQFSLKKHTKGSKIERIEFIIKGL